MEELSKSITAYFEESGTVQSLSGSKQFFDDNYDEEQDFDDIGYNGLDYDDYDPNQPLQPLIPLKYTSTLSSTTSSFNYGCIDDEDDEDDIKQIDGIDLDKKVNKDDSIINEDKFEMFFNSFIDCELEGEVNVCQWILSFKELSNQLTEKDIYKLFKCIDCEHSGYIDSVDFITFCNKTFSTNNDNDNDNDNDNANDNDGCGDIKRLQSVLINAIKDHPFYIRI